MFKDVQVLIVGAGAAGIAAACRLLEQGFQNVRVFEAGDRIGGRVHTVEFGAYIADNVVELGAEYVHGERGNISHELASRHNLLEGSNLLTNTEKWMFANSQGEIIPREQSTELLNIYHEIYTVMPNKITDFEGSFGEYFTQEYYKAFKENPFTNFTRAEEFLEWICKYESIIESCDSWSEVSASGLAEYWICEGNPLLNWKGRGYKTLFEVLMNKFTPAASELPLLEKVDFKKVVSSIDYSSKNRITIRTTDNSEHNADHVIFTPSLGVLKEQHSNLFTPPLPELKRRAIQGLGFGTVDKIIFEFPYKWWPEDIAGFNLVWSKEDKTKFVQSSDKGNEWLADVFHFSTIDHQPRLLSGWLTGPCARHVEDLKDSTVLDGFYDMLQRFFSKKFDIPKPINMIRSKWNQNKHFRGSYSFRTLESKNLDIWAKDLAEPIINPTGKPVLLFGGEATHEHYYSTVHGAVESGIREANRLIEYYRYEALEYISFCSLDTKLKRP
ncbi:possible lysine-specific histone demethylase 1 isoform X1 [Neodiprion fabricii]|uniref:possible lysine-specific histone demethylase 1 isoform X1 n=1 Tax=Neodiprion fabricii TaxID=2872261 RepID=UPI001ED8FE57|nr:possible lysine-specific histone demethylase 1 isoform X1 [Neodiprion fabricii]